MNISKYSCFICGLEIDDSIDLEVHLNIHSGLLMFECGSCEMAYPRENLLRSHYMLTHSQADELIRCSFCPELFSSNQRAEAHRKLHSISRCPMCPAVPLDQMTPCTVYLHSHINSLHRDRVPELLKAFNLMEGLHAGNSAADIMNLRAQKGLSGDYKLDKAMIPKMCELYEMLTTNRFSKAMLIKILAPRRSSAIVADLDSYFNKMGCTTVKLRYIDIFQIYRIAPCCGRQFETLGRYNRHVKVCMPEVYAHLMIKDITMTAPSQITYNQLRVRQVQRRSNPSALQSAQNKAAKEQGPKLPCPVCQKEFATDGQLVSHIRKLHPEVPVPKIRKKRIVKI